MKFTINGFSQRRLIKLGLDSTDALILRCFVDFKDTEKMKAEMIENERYYWIKYEWLIQELPILGLKTKDSVYRRLKKMVNAGVLGHKTKKQGGTYSFFKLGKEYYSLISDDYSEVQPDDNSDEKSEGSDEKPIPVGCKSVGGTDEKSDQKIHLQKRSFSSCSSKEFSEIKKVFDQNIHPITPIEAQKLIAYLDDDGMDYRLIIKAIEIAVCNAKRYLGYIEGILKRWREDNLLTLEAVEAYIRDYRDRKNKKGAVKDGYRDTSKKESGNSFEGYRPPEGKLSDEVAGLTDEELNRLIEEQGI
ncbi:DnaD domain-containing protein [Tepidibacter hydrothermalis]|uniref:DnaD domain protein n=1 Tax=Tepidibacter hydrothermalis TaxID=3036126 RepID=A0ABY8EGT8_9FIRM|nr:DnaD domain protein [Tepidibacter hydrothermalis]WFD11986.1 DnaD domain protein [Tepidibacter hydrothermalis]